jgi:uncharacterized protein YkwD
MHFAIIMLVLASQPPVETRDLEQQTLRLINQEREKEQSAPLQMNPRLVQAAQTHSRNMAEEGKLTHDLGGSPFERITAAGYRWRTAGENIGATFGDGPDPQEMVERWMNSEIHRNNILNPAFTETGIGVKQKDGATYYTKVFGSR